MSVWSKIGIGFGVLLAISLAVAGYRVYVNSQDVSDQIAEIDYKIEELPELEKDVFTLCMQDKQGTAQDIASCQESTQRQIHTLSQDLTNTKNDLENKKIWELVY